MEQEMPDYETIRAAVVSEKWALEKVLACYGDEINRLAMVKKRQPDGSIIPLVKSSFFMSSSLYSVVLKWCPVLQKHLMRRYDKKNEDMRKTLILSHFHIGL